jgi:hypothetical protein
VVKAPRSKPQIPKKVQTARSEPSGATLSGLWVFDAGDPRVARSSQPWAGGRNPFGIVVRQPWAGERNAFGIADLSGIGVVNFVITFSKLPAVPGANHQSLPIGKVEGRADRR